MNFRFTLQYDGTDFHGWQVQAGAQANVRTVQGELASVLTRLEGAPITVHGAGRTDAGVHALAQVANARLLRRAIAADKLRAALNGNLSADMRVVKVDEADDDFHARFSATGKTYRYRIINAAFASPFLRRYALLETRPLNVEAMRRAAQVFVGRHDWTAFSSAQSDAATRVRTVTHLNVCSVEDESAGGRIIEIEASAEGFLRYMVRSIAGALLAVGRDEITEADITEAIESGVRPHRCVTAAPYGLTLVRVHYDAAR